MIQNFESAKHTEIDSLHFSFLTSYLVKVVVNALTLNFVFGDIFVKPKEGTFQQNIATAHMFD